jgi:hypothetical protein
MILTVWNSTFRACCFITILSIIYSNILTLIIGTMYPVQASCDDQLSHTTSALNYYLSNSCLIYEYSAKDVQSCLKNETIVFMGDSRARNMFMATRILMKLSPVKDYNLKFQDGRLNVRNVSGFPNILFIWDPFLNSSIRVEDNSRLIISTGLWHLRHLPFNVAYNQFTQNVDGIIQDYGNKTRSLTIKLISPVIEGELESERQKV